MESGESTVSTDKVLIDLHSTDWQVRMEAVQIASEILQSSPPSDAVAKLASEFSRLATDEKWEVRNAVAVAVRYLRHNDFDKILAKLLEDSHYDVRRSAEISVRKRRQASALGPWSEEISLSTKEHEQYLRKSFPSAVANRALKISEKRLELFIKTSSHELKRVITPLASRITKAKRLVPIRAPKKLREHLEKAEERCEFLTKLLEDMEAWTQESKQEFRKENLKSVMEEALNLVRECFEKRKPDLKVDSSIQIEADIWLDVPRPRIILAFSNIIQNSYEAIKREGTVKITAHSQNGAVHIRFEDNGSGMSAETRSVAMRPFTSTKGSTGFGLAIAYKIIHDECKGDIEIPPTDKGSIVEVLLPRHHGTD